MKNRRNLTLAAAAVVVLAAPVVVGILAVPLLRAQSPAVDTPKWEVASIKPCAAANLPPGARGGGAPPSFSPDRMTLPCETVMGLIQSAYVIFANGDFNLFNMATIPTEGGPAWIKSERYAIEAKAEKTASQGMMQGPMLQTLLEDRFRLKVHWETREVPLYALTVAKGGPKLKLHVEGSCTPRPPLVPTFPLSLPPQLPQGERYCSMAGGLRGPTAVNVVIDAEGATIDEFCKTFLNGGGGNPDRRVIDKTGLTGKFDIHLEFAPSEATIQRRAEVTGAPVAEPTAPEIFTAIQEQLGLKLEPTKGPGQFLVIDSVERPSPN